MAERMILILPENTKTRLKRYCEEKGTTMTHIVKKLILDYMKKKGV